ncbi:MAG: phosphate ABC transporter permease [Candidatus Omnitrophica bacterium CG11_big_fil_rev_8_21_14_0_20_45_26]|uniref:Phosphate ABC transporter permease n=1 Tax=Candidatus Abzuiibacterium crystallinum TaxID=1974748 RepID=A0A2H0LS06_9BACT|nr:MAG: phosphate ABC transporter permease [Candidatus Omnitrophica bacterium CG11_big_fil_rev_8_21_14_0_20_45_26]PIW65342.1 MAG: phosphate ABC transporter permease [Candidatus Omnitrophica bacterium CG12_big_fil_rev_8_21_14_0_65_45_16]
MISRTLKNQLFITFSRLSGFFVLALLAGVIGVIAVKGMGAISFNFIFSPMQEGGLSGGIIFQIAGTIILITTALVISLPLATGAAIVKSIYWKDTRQAGAYQFFLYVLNGMPSILLGVFGFFFFVKFLGWGKSWLTGGILLAIMILPVAAISIAGGMERIPREYIDNARALGLSTPQIIRSVYLPQSFSSMLSGLFLGLARAVGETAPIMFTATVFAGAVWPDGIIENPVLSLPYHIFNLVQESYDPRAASNAWGSALVLMVFASVFSMLTIIFRLSAHEEARGS